MGVMVKEIIVLFDMDNVLLTPGGYRMAFRDALRYRLSKGDVADRIPLESLPEIFESMGVTNEWDMMAVTLGVLVDDLLGHKDELPSLNSLDDFVDWLASLPADHFMINYRQKIREVVKHAAPGKPVSLSLYHACQEDSTNSLFPNLKRLENFASSLLAHTPDVYQSGLTRMFQNLILGSKEFEAAYHLPAEVQCDSYLEKYDHSNLSQENRDWVLRRASSGQIRPVLFTARPSYPPRGVELPERTLYSPEAEAGARLVGLDGLPLIGIGSMEYMAGKAGKSLNELLKPNVFHAVAAVFASVYNDDLKALHAAYQWCFAGQVGGEMDVEWDRPLEIHVFEDSPGGVRAAIGAVELFRQRGVDCELVIWGVADHPDKLSSLEKLGGQVFSCLDAALLAFRKMVSKNGND
ncbi:MAG: hypothetical protein GYA48_00495 [Chloroflexi bacterium]|nr:hypothetical protein [Chloroflexota bacterium]